MRRYLQTLCYNDIKKELDRVLLVQRMKIVKRINFMQRFLLKNETKLQFFQNEVLQQTNQIAGWKAPLRYTSQTSQV